MSLTIKEMFENIMSASRAALERDYNQCLKSIVEMKARHSGSAGKKVRTKWI